MEKPVIVCLHGFLGLPEDWTLLPWHGLGPRLYINLWQSFARLQPQSLKEWAERIVIPSSCWGVGYSLGGRLLMHLLLAQPDKFKGAVMVSAHPGLAHDGEREARQQSDQLWAERVRREPWTDFLTQWNSQAVLQTSQPLWRRESDFDRELLAAVLELSSLSRQQDLREPLAQLRLPRLWLAGERDHKFSALLEELPGACGETVRMAQAGHRLPWDRPEDFTQRLSQFVLHRRPDT